MNELEARTVVPVFPVAAGKVTAGTRPLAGTRPRRLGSPSLAFWVFQQKAREAWPALEAGVLRSRRGKRWGASAG